MHYTCHSVSEGCAFSAQQCAMQSVESPFWSIEVQRCLKSLLLGIPRLVFAPSSIAPSLRFTSTRIYARDAVHLPRRPFAKVHSGIKHSFHFATLYFPHAYCRMRSVALFNCSRDAEVYFHDIPRISRCLRKLRICLRRSFVHLHVFRKNGFTIQRRRISLIEFRRLRSLHSK